MHETYPVLYNPEPIDSSEESRLLEPGDPGFDLFLELHERLAAIRPALGVVLDRVHTEVSPAAVEVGDTLRLSDSKPNTIQHVTKLRLQQLRAGWIIAQAESAADADTVLPTDWRYRSGSETAWEQDPKELGPPVLVALSGLHIVASSLYSNLV